MQTRCPGCDTTFRVTPEQLKARAGKVRCGKCQTVFSALDSLVEEVAPQPLIVPLAPKAVPQPLSAPLAPKPQHASDLVVREVDILLESSTEIETIKSVADLPPERRAEPLIKPLADPIIEPAIEPVVELVAEPVIEPVIEPAGKSLTDAAAQAFVTTSVLTVPRDTTEIPGYSKWAEGAVSSSMLSASGESSRWPFTLVALLLVLALLGQLVFHFRSEIAIAAPALRPALTVLSETLGSDIPLPHRADLVSIETSDLQADTARSNLLVLQATLRNRASYAQAYPLLELSLTDTQDAAIARRVFQPDEYLPSQNRSDPSFSASTDIAVRLWIEAKDITAAGYRVYVFYP